MIQSVLYLILAGLGLGFLVFIHELGHYFMARHVGMTVEAFGIGFGKPIFTWEHKGVKWNLCWIPFGGYVRIKGMEKKGGVEPHLVPDGFFGKRPIDRIKVACMGPFSNIVFAFLAFFAIWMSGGRQKSFSEYTHFIGWMDPCSQLYQDGVRPGDELVSYDKRPFQGFRDLIYASVMSGETASIQGYKIDYMGGNKEPFLYKLSTYQNPESVTRGISTIGILSPASFLFYQPTPENLKPGSPVYNSGIQPKDRIVWVDGEFVFSVPHLSAVLNEPKALLTVKRGEQLFLSRVPRVKISDIRMSAQQRAELDDWQHELNLKNKVEQLFFIPYILSHGATVESQNTYLDEGAKECVYSTAYRSPLSLPLLPGDQILAVDGVPISSSIDLLEKLQTRNVRVIVQRDENLPALSWKDADSYFSKSLDSQKIQEITAALGSASPVSQAGSFYLLAPIQPKPLSQLPLTEEQKKSVSERESSLKKEIEAMQDQKEKARILQQLENNEKQLKLGIALYDAQVSYNPAPWVLFSDVIKDAWRTLSSLFTGMLSPKWMSGPVGIVSVIQQSWGVGVKEALFWMGLISLNLGILNLLPLPVLDGGHICFSLVEMVTKKPIKAKTMERLIFPFIVGLIALFVFLTYHDLSRIFTRYF